MPFDVRQLLTSPSVTRELVTQLYGYIIESITGEQPNIKRDARRTYIDWRPGQAEKLRAFLISQLKEKSMTSEELATGPPSLLPFSEVIIDTKTVLMPLLLKLALPWTALSALGGALLFGRRKKHG